MLDADISKFFDTIEHDWLIKFIEHRVADGAIVRLIRKWLNAGVLEEGRLKAGTDLKDAFARLNASRKVVVYSDDIYEASVVWFALQLMGFDVRIYTWQDWLAHAVKNI